MSSTASRHVAQLQTCRELRVQHVNRALVYAVISAAITALLALANAPARPFAASLLVAIGFTLLAIVRYVCWTRVVRTWTEVVRTQAELDNEYL